MIIKELFNLNTKPGEKLVIETSLEDKLVDFCHEHCSEFIETIKESNSKFLYHGFRITNKTIFLGQTRNDRSPKDMGLITQKIIDSLLSELGMTALRSNSIFCTTRREEAEEYGLVYIIFPINGFNLTYSTKVDDLWKWFDSNYQTFNINQLEDMSVEEFQKLFDFHDEPWVSAFNSGHEILISGKYVAIREKENIRLINRILGKK